TVFRRIAALIRCRFQRQQRACALTQHLGPAARPMLRNHHESGARQQSGYLRGAGLIPLSCPESLTCFRESSVCGRPCELEAVRTPRPETLDTDERTIVGFHDGLESAAVPRQRF